VISQFLLNIATITENRKLNLRADIQKLSSSGISVI